MSTSIKVFLEGDCPHCGKPAKTRPLIFSSVENINKAMIQREMSQLTCDRCFMEKRLGIKPEVLGGKTSDNKILEKQG